MDVGPNHKCLSDFSAALAVDQKFGLAPAADAVSVFTTTLNIRLRKRARDYWVVGLNPWGGVLLL